MEKFSWIKDALIQIIFISFAVTFTVVIAQISISEQYTAYHEAKLEAKAQNLARNAALMFSETDIKNADGMSFYLDVIFPQEQESSEKIQYVLFTPSGTIAASGMGSGEVLPQNVLLGEHEYSFMDGHIYRAFFPVYVDGSLHYILMLHIDDAAFIEFGNELSGNLYSSLFRGCLMMAVGYIIFTAISNLRKKKDPYAGMTEEERLIKEAEDRRNKKQKPRLIVQFISMGATALLALPFFMFHLRTDGTLSTVMLVIATIFITTSAAHLLRLFIWFFAWYYKRPITGYAAQTMQFLVFLLVFLSMYSYSIQSGFSTQIGYSIIDELRTSSVFAGIALSGGDFADFTLIERANEMNFGGHKESIIVIRTGTGFSVLGDELQDISDAYDLFHSAWDGQSAVSGLRGDYKYGVTVIANRAFDDVIALAIVRQPVAVQADEMRSATIDFLLAMSATVFAFVFLFVEINKMLEVVNVPDITQEHELRFAKSVSSLMFIANACRYIPLYFFVIVVHDIYINHPITWLPQEVATVLPLAVVVFVMAIGGGIVSRLIRYNSRKMMILGCFIGTLGFLSLTLANTLPVLLLLLVFAYTGVSVVYNGLWNFASEITSNVGLEDMKANTLSAEYLGGMAGAVIGAMVFDKIGLFAAFALSAVVMLALAALIRTMLPVGVPEEVAEKREFGLIRFLFSKRIFVYLFLLLMPFILGEFFIEQFTPLYADSIALSPGAASWASLLMTLALAFVAPGIIRFCSGRVSSKVISVSTNFLAAAGLVLFSLMPGIIAMYAAAALIGLSVGIGKNIINEGFEELEETKKYTNSGYVYNLFDALFGFMGAALFTLAHSLSHNGEYVMSVAAIVVVATLLFVVFANRRGRT